MTSTSANDPSILDDAKREQLKNIEINRIKAKARIRAQAEAEADTQSSSNANGKRPLRVTEGDSASPTKQSKAQDANAPLKRDTRLMGRYLDYDLSKMVNSKGGFLVEEKSNFDEETRRKEKERELQRLKQSFDPRESSVHIEKDKNPRCADCGSVDIDHQYRKAFRVHVCSNCRTEKPERYSLLTKTECKQDYLLTDPELRDEEVMPHLLKANPHSSTWNNMMLFVRFQVEEFAFKKWGGPEGLDAEWEKRMSDKRAKRSKKFEDGLKDLRRKTRESGWAKRKAEEHVHTYGVPDKALGIQRCTVCGFEVEVEEFSGF
ncbi:DNA repair protein [Ceratobasidium sp. AG-I]|nr:DNA repair protein [Ceratobasidium sp. AG-I]